MRIFVDVLFCSVFAFALYSGDSSAPRLVSHSKSQVSAHGYWTGEAAVEEHCFDAYLANALLKFFNQEQAKTIVDFGCGKGDYVKVLRYNQFHCEGYDGNPDTGKISGGIAKVLDLSAPVDLGKRFDWVLSLEVGEHLPKEFETTFIENLHRHNTRGIVLSWAVIGQGGFGHFNEQDNNYIKEVMKKYGYINDEKAEQNLRNHSSLSWFKNTIMVFRKGKN